MIVKMHHRNPPYYVRLTLIAGVFVLCAFILAGRFFQLQILQYHTYHVLAADAHEVQASLVPKRGTIYIRDHLHGTLYPIAKDRDAWQVYAVPREMKEPAKMATSVAAILLVSEEELTRKFSVTSSAYVLLTKDASLEAVQQLQSQHLQGIGMNKVPARMYPEQGMGGQLLGFVSLNEKNERVGRYGLEGFYQETLAGEAGSLLAEKDAAGRRLAIGALELKEAKNGSDLILTIDRAIQYQACQKIKEAVALFEAESGTVLIMDAQNGAILALCSAPDFDPANYGKIFDIGVLNNPATFSAFEPGSIFKAMTMAAGLDLGKVTPFLTYTDPGELRIENFSIFNSDKQAHGNQTMTQVLEKSLNTGAIFVQQLIGKEAFRDYVTRFGFGDQTGVDLPSEVKGNIASLTKSGKIFAATGSFGQGITATPIQMVAAYAALGNGGKLFRPFMVKEIRRPDGTHEIIQPQIVRQVISERTSRLITGMLVSVVEHGHGKRAGVPGYYVAGKTGTAQVFAPQGGYLPDLTIGSFAGYAPADNPRFAMMVKIEHPKTVKFAESSAAPVFGDLAKFLLSYFQIPPDRPIKKEVGVAPKL
ncbi:penicillin-binding protein 2 [Candidatus Uhrbacteria bacterium]|nr:penicillin-binding protein 2 [Candidatus Uhrbacteria bacterium]